MQISTFFLREFAKQNRYLQLSMFERIKTNSETVKRHWFIATGFEMQ